MSAPIQDTNALSSCDRDLPYEVADCGDTSRWDVGRWATTTTALTVLLRVTSYSSWRCPSSPIAVPTRRWRARPTRTSPDAARRRTGAQTLARLVARSNSRRRSGERRRSKRLAAETFPQPMDCPIKGNIDSKGQRIYHVLGGQWYDRTRNDPAKGERWFCTEEEARAAGWRPARG